MANRTAVLLLVLSGFLLLSGCQDRKVVQENTQLKAQVLDLQKQLGDMGNRVEQANKAKDDLTKENATLKAELNRLKAPRGKAKSTKSKRRRRA